MSIPLNHHYVSQCQIKHFFNVSDKKIYLFDKETKRFYSKETKKTVFSEKLSNTRFINGELDHITLEQDLNLNFENFYDRHITTIQQALDSHNTIDVSCRDSLLELTKYGVIGDFRTPNEPPRGRAPRYLD